MISIARPSVSSLNSRSKGFISNSNRVTIIKDLDLGIELLKSHLKVLPGHGSRDDSLDCIDLATAAVEYGRLLDEISSLLMRTTLVGLHRVLLSDRAYLSGERVDNYDTTSSTPEVDEEVLDNLSNRVARLHNWLEVR